METTLRLDPETLRELRQDPDQALFRALYSDAERANILIRENVPEELHHLFQGNKATPANVPNADDPSRQTFIDGVFEIGGTDEKPNAVGMLAFVREWSPEAKNRLDRYLRSIMLHYASRGLKPRILPIVFHCDLAPGMEPNG